jgi:hypothetical protein
MSENWRWWISTDEERYQGPYDSREEAIAVGTDDYGGDAFHICEATQGMLNLRPFWADDIYDRLQDVNEERVDPEDGELFRKSPTKEQDADLANMVNDAIEAWARKHNIDTRAWAFDSQRNSERIDPAKAS